MVLPIDFDEQSRVTHTSAPLASSVVPRPVNFLQDIQSAGRLEKKLTGFAAAFVGQPLSHSQIFRNYIRGLVFG
jgi:hypothetical protein